MVQGLSYDLEYQVCCDFFSLLSDDICVSVQEIHRSLKSDYIWVESILGLSSNDSASENYTMET